MTEMILDINAIPSYLTTRLRSNKVKIRESNKVITIESAEEPEQVKTYSCPFLGIAMDSNVSVDSFLKWKREERVRESVVCQQ